MNRNTNKTIELSKQSIPYKVIRNNRSKNIRLYVNVSGELEVRIPKRVKEESIGEILTRHSKWILKHFPQKKLQTEYFFFGKRIHIKHSYDFFLSETEFAFNNNTLNISSPSNSTDSSNLLFQKWLKLKAEEYIIPRVEELADKNDFRTNRVTIRRQKTRWGSCSSKGSLSFNSRLMCFDKNVIDYVIIHELCHLKEMNHSDKFWRFVEKFIPDYKKHVIKLRTLNYRSQ
jgi:predicted metal-dependent hydrolase